MKRVGCVFLLVAKFYCGFLCAQPVNLITKNTGDSQEDIDLRWNNMEYGCLRAFFFENNCDDEMQNANGTPTDVSYDPCIRHWPARNPAEKPYFGKTVVVESAACADSLRRLTDFSPGCRALPGGT